MIGLAIVGIALGGLILKIGLPAGPAFALAFLIVGAAAVTVEVWLDRVAPLFGCATLALGACMGGGWLAMELDDAGLPKWAAISAVLLLGVGILVGLAKVAARRVQTHSKRGQLAERRGWQHVPHADVPVPGPRSAAMLAATPGAWTTTGRDVVSATVNGLPVTMFDLARPTGKHERVQSVWLVRLPMVLPYAVLATYQDRDQPRMAVSGTDDEAFAGRLLTPQVRSAAVSLKRTVWIENAYLCAIWDSGARIGVSATAVEQSIDGLAALAAVLPWEAIAPYARPVQA